MLYDLIIQVLAGAIFGLIPFFLGRFFGKPGWGKLGLLICALVALLRVEFSVFSCIGFSIAVFVCRRDFAWPQKEPEPQQPQPVVYNTGVTGALKVVCLSGPLRGQSYPVPQGGTLIGRGANCAVRLPEGTPGVSNQHCAVRWQQGVPVLVDLGSTYGTFLGNGQRLPPQYPIEVAAGTRFYLADANCLFQVAVA